MIDFGLWMPIPIGLILTALGLVTAGYLWGLVLDIKQRLTDSTGETDD